jgi:DNA-binding transcriptional regulator YdaS (Cro superfamily)
METKSAIERAFAAAGGMAALAKSLGRTRMGVWHWKKGQVPAELCPEIERLTGVRCEELRPDVSWGVLRSQAVS